MTDALGLITLDHVVGTVNDTNDGEHVCDACGRAFDSEDALEQHVREVGLVD